MTRAKKLNTKPDNVSDKPFSAASRGKNGAIIDMEQKLMKSTPANRIKVIFWLPEKFLIASGSKCELVLKEKKYLKRFKKVFFILYLNNLSLILLASRAV